MAKPPEPVEPSPVSIHPVVRNLQNLVSARPGPSAAFPQGLIGLADTTAEDEAASRWADFASAYGDSMA
jgi:hypothetical protein